MAVAPIIVWTGLALELMGALAMLSAGGELCGTVMLALYVALTAATQHWPQAAAFSSLDHAALAPLLSDVTMLGALALVFGFALERKRAKKAAAGVPAKKLN